MKTKLLVISFFLLTIIENAFSQSYVPLLNNSAWNIVSANFGGSQNYIINPGVDVVIGSYTYKKFFDPLYNTDIYIREDVSAKKVYRRISNVDQLLFDFSLQVSNTITLANGSTYTVNSISDVNVNGSTRRKFYLDNGFSGETWIEGVGNSRHPLKPSYELPTDPYIYLTCSSQNGMNIYNHGLANGGTPTDCSMLLSVKEDNYLTHKINFTPNPFKTELTITTEIVLENATLLIYNSLGQIVKDFKTINGKKITLNRDNLTTGIYFAQLFQNGKLLTMNKIIITD